MTDAQIDDFITAGQIAWAYITIVLLIVFVSTSLRLLLRYYLNKRDDKRNKSRNFDLRE